MRPFGRLFSRPSLLESCFVLAIVALAATIGLGSLEAIETVKVRRQVRDLRLLDAAVRDYVGHHHRLPGDRDADGLFDSDSLVWRDLEGARLLTHRHRSAFGGYYIFGHARRPAGSGTRGSGNYVELRVPGCAARAIDGTMDDGAPSRGIVSSRTGYRGRSMIPLRYHFTD